MRRFRPFAALAAAASMLLGGVTTDAHRPPTPWVGAAQPPAPSPRQQAPDARAAERLTPAPGTTRRLAVLGVASGAPLPPWIDRDGRLLREVR